MATLEEFINHVGPHVHVTVRKRQVVIASHSSAPPISMTFRGGTQPQLVAGTLLVWPKVMVNPSPSRKLRSLY